MREKRVRHVCSISLAAARFLVAAAPHVSPAGLTSSPLWPRDGSGSPGGKVSNRNLGVGDPTSQHTACFSFPPWTEPSWALVPRPGSGSRCGPSPAVQGAPRTFLPGHHAVNSPIICGKKKISKAYQFLSSLYQKVSYHFCLFLCKNGTVVHAKPRQGWGRPK